MQRFLSSNPLLIGIVFAIAAVYVLGNALLSRFEAEVGPPPAPGEGRIVLPAPEDEDAGRSSDGIPARIDRERLGTPGGDAVWIHGVASTDELSFAGTLEFRTRGSEEAWRAEAGADGFFELVLERPGAYSVVFRPKDAPGTPSTIELAVEIPAVEEHVLDLGLPAGRIVGNVLRPDGTAVPDVHVELHAMQADGAALQPLAVARTDESGAFSFPLLERDSYDVLARAGESERVARRTVELARGARESVVLHLEE